jgi:hypothetical protein
MNVIPFTYLNHNYNSIFKLLELKIWTWGKNYKYLYMTFSCTVAITTHLLN